MLLGLLAVLLAALNVRDFGAKGDGISDDTEALKRCAAAAAERAFPRSYVLRQFGRACASEEPVEAIVFPKGTYRISDRIVFDKSTYLVGRDGARIVNVAQGKETFYCRDAFRFCVEGLAFEGGAVHLRNYTHNWDKSFFHVADCSFSGAGEFAVVSTSFVEGKDEFDEENWRGRKGHAYNNSTLIVVERCRFADNASAIWAWSDGTCVRNCSFVAPAKARLPQLRVSNGGFEGVEVYCHDLDIAFPDGSEGDPGAFAFEGGRVYIENCRVRAKGALSTVVSTADFCNYSSPAQLVLRGLELETGAAPVVRVAGGSGPNRVSAYDLKVVGSRASARKRVLSYDVEPTEDALAAGKASRRMMRNLPLEDVFGFAFRGCEGCDTRLPRVLERFRRDAPPAEWKRPIPVGSGGLFALKMPGGKDILPEGEIGRLSYQDQHDETEALDALLDRARRSGGGVIRLPGRWFRISRTLTVPPNTRLSSYGRAVVSMMDDASPAFTAETGARVAFENLVIVGGLNAFRAPEKGAANFYRTFLCGQFAASIEARSRTPLGYGILMSGSQINGPYAYRGNARAVIDSTWFHQMPERPRGEIRDEFSAIVNEAGGELVLRELVTVPCYFFDYPKTVIYRNERPELKGEYRWIDNHGTLSSVNVRYGGEWGGLTPIYHFGSAKTYLEGGTVELYNDDGIGVFSKTAVVVADSEMPDVTTIDAASSLRGNRFGSVRRLARAKYEPIKVREAMNFPFAVFGK